MRVRIIGAGLAGCALAYFLKRAGAAPVVYEAGGEIAPGASGNAAGLYNPRFTAAFGAEAEFYSAAFALALETFPGLGDIGWNPCGALHLMTDGQKARRFGKTAESWPAPEMRLCNAREASEIAGVEISYDALFLPRSGSVSPRKLCAAYGSGVDFRFRSPVGDLAEIGAAIGPGVSSPPCYAGDFEDRRAEATVLACGMAARAFFPGLPLRPVRGQVTFAKASPRSAGLKTNLCYGGYVSAPAGGLHMAGATFQRGVDHAGVLPGDDAENLAKLAAFIPALGGLEAAGARAGVRAATPDHFPVAGWMGGRLYVSAGHGSHGILSALMAARVLTDMILERPQGVSPRVIERLSPARF